MLKSTIRTKRQYMECTVGPLTLAVHKQTQNLHCLHFILFIYFLFRYFDIHVELQFS